MDGQVVHFEVPADNVERATKFYKTIFGWKLDGVPEMGYTMVSTTPSDENGMPRAPGAINGGMLKRQAPVRAPVITIMVDDIDSTAKAIEKAGGKIVRKKESIGPWGFAAYFTDPEGNVMGLFQAPPPS